MMESCSIATWPYEHTASECASKGALIETAFTFFIVSVSSVNLPETVFTIQYLFCAGDTHVSCFYVYRHIFKHTH